jgi:hypothetical protein
MRGSNSRINTFFIGDGANSNKPLSTALDTCSNKQRLERVSCQNRAGKTSSHGTEITHVIDHHPKSLTSVSRGFSLDHYRKSLHARISCFVVSSIAAFNSFFSPYPIASTFKGNHQVCMVNYLKKFPNRNSLQFSLSIIFVLIVPRGPRLPIFGLNRMPIGCLNSTSVSLIFCYSIIAHYVPIENKAQ